MDCWKMWSGGFRQRFQQCRPEGELKVLGSNQPVSPPMNLSAINFGMSTLPIYPWQPVTMTHMSIFSKFNRSNFV